MEWYVHITLPTHDEWSARGDELANGDSPVLSNSHTDCFSLPLR